MANPSKAKGTAAESAIVRYAREHGFAGAMRPALSGSADRGDVWLEPGPTAIIESKSVAGAAALGQPGLAQFATWWRQTLVEAVNAGAALGILVVKRRGTTDPGRWFAWIPAWLIVAAANGDIAAASLPRSLIEPVCTTLEHALLLARMAGYGDATSEHEGRTLDPFDLEPGSLRDHPGASSMHG